mmetsp:Transcript_5012/g.7434  ORF Transcript_5012/g.7434 Transcript_5012/m.7434 type:complete len:572 (+) Transcript_5012:93-1808(+)
MDASSRWDNNTQLMSYVSNDINKQLEGIKEDIRKKYTLMIENSKRRSKPFGGNHANSKACLLKNHDDHLTLKKSGSKRDTFRIVKSESIFSPKSRYHNRLDPTIQMELYHSLHRYQQKVKHHIHGIQQSIKTNYLLFHFDQPFTPMEHKRRYYLPEAFSHTFRHHYPKSKHAMTRKHVNGQSTALSTPSPLPSIRTLQKRHRRRRLASPFSSPHRKSLKLKMMQVILSRLTNAIIMCSNGISFHSNVPSSNPPISIDHLKHIHHSIFFKTSIDGQFGYGTNGYECAIYSMNPKDATYSKCKFKSLVSDLKTSPTHFPHGLLASTVGSEGSDATLVYFGKPLSDDDSSRSPIALPLYSLSDEKIWTFDCHSNMVALGSTSGYSIIDLKKNCVLHSNHLSLFESSDVLSQSFDVKGSVLFNGCRSGKLLISDVRSSSSKDSQIVMSSAISSINLLSNNLSLLCTSLDGSAHLFDLRMMVSHHTGNPVIEYIPSGLVDPQRRTLRPFVDKCESTFMIGDVHSNILAFDLASGKPLFQIHQEGSSLISSIHMDCHDHLLLSSLSSGVFRTSLVSS